MPKIQRVTDLANEYKRFGRKNVFVDKSFRSSHQNACGGKSWNEGPESWEVTFLIDDPDDNQDGQSSDD